MFCIISTCTVMSIKHIARLVGYCALMVAESALGLVCAAAAATLKLPLYSWHDQLSSLLFRFFRVLRPTLKVDRSGSPCAISKSYHIRIVWISYYYCYYC